MKTWQHVLAVILLAALAWFAHFAGWREVGFFSDDHSFAVIAMGWSPGDARHMADVLAFSYPEPQGRPLGFLLGLELPYFGYRIAGVFGMFAIGWLILSLNAALLYALLVRRLPRPLPWLGAIAFLLFPADTTRPFLCHAHILQPSITFSLLAAHLMLDRRWWVRAIGYPVAGLCLITYETALLPLFALPLLNAEWMVKPRQRATGVDVPDAAHSASKLPGLLPWLRRFVVHGVLLATLIGVVAVTRAHGGEYRAVGATGSKADLVTEVVLGSIRGPLAAGQACLRRPWQQLVAVVHRPGHAAIIALAAIGFGLTIGVGQSRLDRSAVRRAAVFALAAVGVSYLFCFTHYPPTCEEGQSTSVHTAAAIGGAVLIAAVITAGLLWRPRLARFAAAIYFALLFGHAMDEQSAFADLWHERQSFWRQVLDLCPDLSDRTVILCDGTMPQPTWYMPVNLWSDAMVPAQVYQFPADDRLPPLLAAYPRTPGQEWRTAVRRDVAGRVVWRVPPCNCPAGQELSPGNTILLRLDGAGRVVRVSGTVDVEGRPFVLRSIPPAGLRVPFPTLPFYHVLTGR